MTEDRCRRLQFVLGLAQKAGQLASGDFGVMQVLKSRKAKLLIVAADAAPHTAETLRYQAGLAQIPAVTGCSAVEQGSAIGKGQRVSVAVLSKNFAEMVIKIVKQEDVNHGKESV